MSAESKPEPQKDAGSKLSFLRHPLTVVLVGSAISSLAIPYISDEERPRVRFELASQYRELDAQMWWWSSRLPTEARLLRIEVDPAILGGIIREYQDNLIQSTAALDKLWEACLRQKQPEPAAMAKIAGLARRELAGLHDRRQDLTGKLVYLFAPPEPTILRLLRQQ